MQIAHWNWRNSPGQLALNIAKANLFLDQQPKVRPFQSIISKTSSPAASESRAVARSECGSRPPKPNTFSSAISRH
ncbi:hypothetical protein [Hyphomicrobium sp.]|uniref:hypothetical protein n=1 Tax=Hyphomicrobium sp. TaxID=82 RepID=UPI003F6F14B3